MAFYLEVPDFPIIKHLGAGGFGSVDLIEHSRLGRVAYKKLTTSRKVSEADQLKLMKEAEIQQNLRHPFIVVLYEATVSPSACGLFLEYMKYGPVDEFVEQYTVPSGWKLQIIYDVSLAILYLHEQNPVIIHGDLKCQNILIGDGYHAKISDFGLALTVKRLSSCEVEQDKVSGTIEYIAPEYLSDPCKTKTEKFDVYAFAITAWEIFSQKHAYRDFCNHSLIWETVKRGMRPGVEELNGRTPDSVIQLIEDSWHKKPEHRPTFKEVSTVLKGLVKEMQPEIERSFNVLFQQEQRGQQSPSSPFHTLRSDLEDHLENMTREEHQLFPPLTLPCFDRNGEEDMANKSSCIRISNRTVH